MDFRHLNPRFLDTQHVQNNREDEIRKDFAIDWAIDNYEQSEHGKVYRPNAYGRYCEACMEFETTPLDFAAFNAVIEEVFWVDGSRFYFHGISPRTDNDYNKKKGYATTTLWTAIPLLVLGYYAYQQKMPVLPSWISGFYDFAFATFYDLYSSYQKFANDAK